MADESQLSIREAKPNRINGWAILLGVITFIGVVAACLAIPGMPKLFHFDGAEPSSVATSAVTTDNHRVNPVPPRLNAPRSATAQPGSQPHPPRPADHKPAKKNLPREQAKSAPSASATEPTPAQAQAVAPSSPTGPALLNNYGTIGISTIENSSVNGTPAPGSGTVPLVQVGPNGKIGKLNLSDIHICTLSSWNVFLDCIDSDSGNLQAVQSTVAAFKERVDAELNKFTDEQIPGCRQQVKDDEKLFLDNVKDEHALVASMRGKPPSCFVEKP